MREDAGFGQDGGKGSGGREEAREIKGFSSRCHFLSQENLQEKLCSFGVFFCRLQLLRTQFSIYERRNLLESNESYQVPETE